MLGCRAVLRRTVGLSGCIIYANARIIHVKYIMCVFGGGGNIFNRSDWIGVDQIGSGWSMRFVALPKA